MATILVIEDSPTVSKAVENLLKGHGYTVHVAYNGLIALNILRTCKPDLILLDIRLPRVDGFQLCLVIRRMPRFVQTPIIMMSGLSGRADIQYARDIGANDYIVKPFDNDHLLAVIEAHLNNAKTEISVTKG